MTTTDFHAAAIDAAPRPVGATEFRSREDVFHHLGEAEQFGYHWRGDLRRRIDFNGATINIFPVTFRHGTKSFPAVALGSPIERRWERRVFVFLDEPMPSSCASEQAIEIAASYPIGVSVETSQDERNQRPAQKESRPNTRTTRAFAQRDLAALGAQAAGVKARDEDYLCPAVGYLVVSEHHLAAILTDDEFAAAAISQYSADFLSNVESFRC